MTPTLLAAKAIIKNLPYTPHTSEDGLFHLARKAHCHLIEGAERWCFIPRNADFVIKIDHELRPKSAACEVEQTRYELAKAEGLEDYFTKPLGSVEYKGNLYYLYEKVKDDSRILSHDTRLSSHKFYQFCDKNDIIDLGIQNIGSRNGRAVVLDYAGLFGL